MSTLPACTLLCFREREIGVYAEREGRKAGGGEERAAAAAGGDGAGAADQCEDEG